MQKKSIWQNSIFIPDKFSQETNNRIDSLNLTKVVYKKPTANTVIQGENERFPLRLRTSQGYPFSNDLFNIIILEDLVGAIRQEEDLIGPIS